MEESEIRAHGKTNEYLGRWVVKYEETPKKSLRFAPQNLQKLKEMDDLAQISVGYELITAGAFKRENLPNMPVEMDPFDREPTDWSIYRKFEFCR